MNARSFDATTRRFATGLPRRAALALMAGALSTLLPGVGATVEAGCKKVGKTCDKNKDCCDGARCKGGKNGKCRCKNRFSKCDKKCSDLDKDENHCGSCDTRCDVGEGEICLDGRCVNVPS